MPVTRNQATRIVLDSLKAAFPTHTDIDPSMRLSELHGFDSVKVIEVIARCERDTGARIDEDQVFMVRSVSDLIGCFTTGNDPTDSDHAAATRTGAAEVGL
ncbi:acyl carrier protein [Nocardia brasiliensis]|uniref:acyl carrier protein n=1 Tax=Nocardia brasiliensis TaxID=37326 RepID=UPI002453EDF6|nr:acyl carrier protein [Nocardia brasiliensis]